MDRNMAQVWDVARAGFLPTGSSVNFYHESLRPHLMVFEDLVELMEKGTLKSRLSSLPVVRVVFDYETCYDQSCLLLETTGECENVFMLFGFLASSYAHRLSEEFKKSNPQDTMSKVADVVAKMPIVLPAGIAVPLKLLAQRLGRKPILDYAGCVLSNWCLVDNSLGMSLENIHILRTFTRTLAEEWFYKIHIMIEYHGGEAIKAMQGMQSVISCAVEEETGDGFSTVQKVIGYMSCMSDSLEEMNEILAKMPDNCKDYEFYNVVRPWLSGWAAPGVVYATDDSHDYEPEIYSGGSGAQSTLLPCLDAFLGISHGADSSGRIDPVVRQRFIDALKKYREYMPPPHREFLSRLENSDSIRMYIDNLIMMRSEIEKKSMKNDIPLVLSEQYRIRAINLGALIKRVKISYNECLQRVLDFRRKHIGFAISYISSEAKKRARALEKAGDHATGQALLKKSATGTGGSMFRNHLMQHINDTRFCLYPTENDSSSKTAPSYQKGSLNASILPGLGRLLPRTSVFARTYER